VPESETVARLTFAPLKDYGEKPTDVMPFWPIAWMRSLIHTAPFPLAVSCCLNGLQKEHFVTDWEQFSESHAISEAAWNGRSFQIPGVQYHLSGLGVLAPGFGGERRT
jgi:hypothetical protein